MNTFTEVEFAAALLACGPHCTTCEECQASRSCCPNVGRYRESVRKQFIDMFAPELPYSCEDEWAKFWQQYIEWVET